MLFVLLSFVPVKLPFCNLSNIFFVGLTAPSRMPQRSQYLISTPHLLFQSGFPIVAFKTLVDGFLHPQHLVGIVSGYASSHCQLQSTLAALRPAKIRHQHSPAFLMMNAGTFLPVARHRQTHLATQVSKEAEGMQHVAFRLKLSSSGLLSQTESAL